MLAHRYTDDHICTTVGQHSHNEYTSLANLSYDVSSKLAKRINQIPKWCRVRAVLSVQISQSIIVVRTPAKRTEILRLCASSS